MSLTIWSKVGSVDPATDQKLMDGLPNELHWNILLQLDVNGLEGVSVVDRRSIGTISEPHFWHLWLEHHQPKLARFSADIKTRDEFINLIKASEGDPDGKDTESIPEYMTMRKQQVILSEMISKYTNDVKHSYRFMRPLCMKQLVALGIERELDLTYALVFMQHDHPSERKYEFSVWKKRPNNNKGEIVATYSSLSTIMYKVASISSNPIGYWDLRLESQMETYVSK